MADLAHSIINGAGPGAGSTAPGNGVGGDSDGLHGLVTQQQAYDWIIGEYNATGLQRRLEVQDLRVRFLPISRTVSLKTLRFFGVTGWPEV